MLRNLVLLVFFGMASLAVNAQDATTAPIRVSVPGHETFMARPDFAAEAGGRYRFERVVVVNETAEAAQRKHTGGASRPVTVPGQVNDISKMGNVIFITCQPGDVCFTYFLRD